ncbi:hypothetical protein GGF46_001996 [Coemansia sp. RSA 552]|nr:hypothetical protein GGF46_001996 [Coemansia sp. RSA 552]
MELSGLVGRWFSIDGSSGIVRYVGPVDGTTGEWLGVEWAKEGRGKHNGTHNNQQYFQCRKQSTPHGSFIRNVKRINWGQTLLEAAKARYIVQMDELLLPKAIDKHRGKIEAPRMDLVIGWQKNLTDLQTLGLDSQEIHGTFGEDLGVLQALRNLHLAQNYLTSWQAVEEILEQIPHRVWLLDISANPFDVPLEIPPGTQVPGVDELRVDTLPVLDWARDVCGLVYRLSVRTLSHGWSQLGDVTGVDPLLLVSLEDLRLEQNQIQSIAPLRQLPNLRHLDVSGNPIASIEPWSATDFPRLQSLNLSRTLINDWSSIDHLRNAVTALGMVGIPLVTPLPVDTSRAHAIARLPKLTKLDGSLIPASERTEMERYYLVLCARSLPPGQPMDSLADRFPRFAELAETHGTPALPSQNTARLKTRLATVQIEVVSKLDDELPRVSASRPLIRSMLVRQLRPLAMRLAKTRSIHQIYLKTDADWILLDNDSRPLSLYAPDGNAAIRVIVPSDPPR